MSVGVLIPARTAGLVAAGAAVGAGLREGANRLVPWDGSGWPWATFVVNVVGCVAIAWALVRIRPATDRWALIAPGLLGGLTTMSTFLVETRALWVAGDTAVAVSYVAVTLAITLGAVDVIRRRTT